jgi:hypothetical protein
MIPAELATDRGLEQRERFGEAILFLGPRNVGHQAQGRHRRRPGEALANRGDRRGTKPKAIHAGVDLDEHFQRTRQHRGFEHLYLLDIVHDDRQTAPGDLLQLGLSEKTLEEKDAAHVTLFAQADRGVEFDQRQSVGVLQRRQDAGEAVTVGIGLDHRQDLRPRRLFAHPRHIRAHRGQVDLCV